LRREPAAPPRGRVPEGSGRRKLDIEALPGAGSSPGVPGAVAASSASCKGTVAGYLDSEVGLGQTSMICRSRVAGYLDSEVGLAYSKF
jgi:hypothetical protein